ncbi:MAG: hypothetical protein F6K03_11690 [Kamptonema sp. SIO4C4]|nr:hypothetical protein [Kamptonema sp. SIO4C4]
MRTHDEAGTGVVLDYFGGVVYEFSLQQAIEAGILCEYDYFVYVTELGEGEYQRFQQLTAKLGRLLQSQEEEAREQAQQVAIQRAKIVKAAGAKLGTLQEIIADFPPQRAMIYCADIQQATAVSGQLARSGVRVARYSSADSNRHHLLQEFAAGRLDGLVAVKCLDEGVDVPAASQAVILASDGSQRQFIQRRGRILRFAPQKSVATLIDVLVVPPLEGEEVKLIESELKRVGHFVQSARNRSHAILTLAETLALYGITYSDFL